MQISDVEGSWRRINNSSDIEALMYLFGNFHDACVRELHIATGHWVHENLSMACDWPTTIHLLVQRQHQRPSAIELRFEEVMEMKMTPPTSGYVAVIFQAALFLENDVFHWSEDSSWTTQTGQSEDSTYITARRLWWRDASEWMGAELRYRRGIGDPVAD